MSEASVAEVLLATLDQATPADLARLDQEIAALRGRLASLEQLRKLLAVRLAGPAAPKPRVPRGTSEAAQGKRADERRRDIVAYLAQRGPRLQSQIVGDLGIPAGSMTALLDHAWFQKTAQGVHITPQARREVLDS